MKLLFKRAFNSLFRNKIFTILIIIIVFISGTMFTMTNSAAESFSKSLNSVISEGALHDYVVKENFKVSEDSHLELGLGTSGTSAITEANVIANQEFLSGNKRKIKIAVNKILTTGDFATDPTVNDANTYVYINYTHEQAEAKPYKIEGSAIYLSSDEFVAYLQSEAKSFKSNLTQIVQTGLSNKYVTEVKKLYGDEIYIKNTRSLSVSQNEKAFKLVEVDTKNDEVNKMIIYDGNKNYLKPLGIDEMIGEIETIIESRGQRKNDYAFNSLKGYRVTAQSAAGSAIQIDDPSSYQAIVSPGYANANGKASISIKTLVEEYENFEKDDVAKEEYKTFISHPDIQKKYENHLVWVDKTPYFIIGIGTTPDYSYPIIDEQHPTVDVKNQAILFVNQRGYERAYDAWRTNPMENYSSIKFTSNVSGVRRNEIVSQIETGTRNGVITDGTTSVNVPKSYFPPNVALVTSAWDMNDQMMLTQERIAFLRQISELVVTLSTATTTLLVIFVSVIVILVFNVIIKMNRKSLATLMSIGYSRNKIALSNSIISFFVGAMPALVGYLTGFGLQYAFINSFSDFWTIPTYGDPFSLVSLMVTFVIPFVFLGVLIYLITYWTLRHPIEAMIRDTVKEKGDWIGAIANHIVFLTISGKYAFALMMKNIGKLALTSVTMLIALVSLSTGMSTLGVANKAYNITSDMYNYEYQINLFSPTEEGGEYRLIRGLDELMKLPTEPTYGATTPVDTTLPHWHIPSPKDADYGLVSSAGETRNIEGAARYLDNKVQWKLLLDEEIAGLNPWGIAERLMPDNQVNIAREDSDKFEKLASEYKGENWVEGDPIGLPINNLPNKISAMDKLINDATDYTPYVITYRNVLVDKDDEPYTYVQSKFNVGSQEHNYNIIGLSDNTAMVDVNTSGISKMSLENKVIPVLINKYIAESLKIKKGDQLDAQVLNMSKRNYASYADPLNGVNNPLNDYKLKVVEVIEGYDNNGFYTSQKIANQVLELNQDSFNGVFTKNPKSKVLTTLPLYSPSGLYIGTDTIIGGWENNLEKMLSNTNVWQYGSDITSDTSKFIELYSRTPYVASTTNVYWSQMTRQTFESTSDLSSTIINLIQATSITLSIIFTVIVASLMLASNRKRIATLSTMGYSKAKISKMYIYTYILPTAVASALMAPLSIGILAGLRTFIIHFGKILIPFKLTWWAPLLSIVIVSLIFIITTLVSIYSQRHDMALKAFKED